MDPKELRDLYGRHCRARVHCQPCGKVHTVTGTLGPGRRPGDVAVDGQTYPSSDIVSVIADGPASGASGIRIRSGMPLMWIALAMAVWLQLLAQR
jgi:hypothetical protein